MDAALDVPCPIKSVITPKKSPAGSIAGSNVPLIAFRESSMIVEFFLITP